MKRQTSACLGLLGCLSVGCFSPDGTAEDTDTDAASASSTSTASTTPTTETSNTGSTTNDSTTDASDTEPATDDSTTDASDTDSTTDESTTDESTTDESTTDESTTDDSADESSGSSDTSEGPGIQCEDGEVVAGEVCFAAFHQVNKQPFRFAYLEDIDFDGDADLIYSAISGELVVQFNGDGSFGLETMSTFNGVSTLDAMGFINFNGDNVLDAVLMSGAGGALYAVSGNTSGAFAIEDIRFSEGSALAMGNMDDVEGDEVVLAVLAGIQVFSVADDGSLDMLSSASIDDFATTSDVQLADLNSDDQLDVIYAGAFGDDDNSQVRAQLGSGDGSLSNVELFPLLDSTAVHDLITGDFDGDGNTDLAAADGPLVRVAFGNGALGFTQVDFAVDSGNAFRLAAADVDQDGIDDIIVGYDDREVLTVFLGTSEQAVVGGVDVELTHSTRTISTGEINGDGVPDIVVSSADQASVTVVRSTN